MPEILDFETLDARYEEAVRLIRQGDPKSAEQERQVRALVPTGIYEHFKSTEADRKFYAVFGVQRGVDHGFYAVSYMALYPPHAFKLASRQLIGRNPATGKHDAFLKPLRNPGSRPGYVGHRFTLVKACAIEDLFETLKPYAS